MIYRTEADAVRRIESLRRFGIWPGYYRVQGGWALTYDLAPFTSRAGYEGSVLS